MVAADQPMLVQSQHALMRKAPHTEYRWNLLDMERFPQWKADIERLVRQYTCKGFLESSPPSIEQLDPTQQSTETYDALQAMTNNWYKWNEDLYDIIQGSLNLSPAKIEYVNTRFSGDLDGNMLWSWVISHADQQKQSQQERLKATLNKLQVTDDTTVGAIDDMLQSVSLAYPKIRGWDQSDSAKISFALRMFTYCSTHHARIVTLTTLHENSLTPLWQSYDQFREKLVEALALDGERTSTANVAMPYAGRTAPNANGKSRTFTNNCSRCDVTNCKGGDNCYIFGNGTPAPRAAQRYAVLVKAFVKHKNLKVAKRLGRLPEDFVTKYKAQMKNARESRAAKETNMTVAIEEEEDDEDFWNQLTSGRANFMICETHEAQFENAPQQYHTQDSDSSSTACNFDETEMAIQQSNMAVEADSDANIASEPREVEAPDVHEFQHKLTAPAPSSTYENHNSLRTMRTVQQGKQQQKTIECTPMRLDPGSSTSSSDASSIRPHRLFNSKLEEHLANSTKHAQRTPNEHMQNIIVSLQAQLRTAQESINQHHQEQLEARKASDYDRRQNQLHYDVLYDKFTNEIKATKIEHNKTIAKSLEKATAETLAAKDAATKAEMTAAELRIERDHLAAQSAEAEQVAAEQIRLLQATTSKLAQADIKLSKNATILAAVKSITKSAAPRRLLQLSVLKPAAILGMLVLARFIPSEVLTLVARCAKRIATRVLLRIITGLIALAQKVVRLKHNANKETCYALSSTQRQGALHDSGCTTLVTRSTDGLLGKLRRIPPKPFSTAGGKTEVSFDGIYKRTMYGASGTSVSFTARWYYDPNMPFDVVGKAALRKELGAKYFDAEDATATRPPIPPRIKLSEYGDVELTLGVSPNGLEWLSYQCPRHTCLTAIADENALSNAEATTLRSSETIMTKTSSGVGMEPMEKVLTPLQKATLEHVRLGHPSLRRMMETLKKTNGGFTVTKDALRELAYNGCDLCNSVKIKLTDPKKQVVSSRSELQTTNPIHTILYDSFGLVSVPSAQFGYHHAHMFYSHKRNVGWIYGSKDLADATVLGIHKKHESNLAVWFPNDKTQVIRMDSFSTNRGKALQDFFLNALIKAEYSPPGQHAYIGDLERLWYPVLTGALIALRQGGAPRAQWFNAMSNQLDSECCLVSRMSDDSPISGYEKALGNRHDISDKYAFYAPGRFALDKGAVQTKWHERARAGFWVGRDIDFVMAGKAGSAIWWDGHIHRTVVNNFRVQEGKFLDLTAVGNQYLPDFPRDTTDHPTVITPGTTVAKKSSSNSEVHLIPQPYNKPPLLPLALTRPKRSLPAQAAMHCGLCNALCATPRCETCDIDYTLSDDPQVVMLTQTLPPVPTMNIVINLCGGCYDSDTNISAHLRRLGIATIDVDNDPTHGGGEHADITSNAVYDFLLLLTRLHRVAGVVAAQTCSSGSVLRMRKLDNASNAAQIRSQEFPDGMPDLSPAYLKELHLSNLLSFRITTLMTIVFQSGGWFISEGPAVRGDMNCPTTFDPAFKGHSSVMNGTPYQQLIVKCNARVLTSAMCSLRESYPQKLTDFLISPNLEQTLGTQLRKLVCNHPTGTHANSFAGSRYGKWDAKPSERWLPELCSIIATGLAAITPRGAESLKLGESDISKWAVQELRATDREKFEKYHCLSNPQSQASLDAHCSALAIIDEDNTRSVLCTTDLDVDPLTQELTVQFIDTASENRNFLYDASVDTVDSLSTRDVGETVLPVITDLAHKWKVPQNEKEFRQCPQRSLWEAADQSEVDALFGRGVFTEVAENEIEEKPRRVWPTKFARKLKENAETREYTPRSRLCCIGTNHEKGKEYERADSPTPMFSSTLMLIGECAVEKGVDFSFDLCQFFRRLS